MVRPNNLQNASKTLSKTLLRPAKLHPLNTTSSQLRHPYSNLLRHQIPPPLQLHNQQRQTTTNPSSTPTAQPTTPKPTSVPLSQPTTTNPSSTPTAQPMTPKPTYVPTSPPTANQSLLHSDCSTNNAKAHSPCPLHRHHQLLQNLHWVQVQRHQHLNQ